MIDNHWLDLAITTSIVAYYHSVPILHGFTCRHGFFFFCDVSSVRHLFPMYPSLVTVKHLQGEITSSIYEIANILATTYLSAAYLLELAGSPCLATLWIPLRCLYFSNQPLLALKVNPHSSSALLLGASSRGSAWIRSAFLQIMPSIIQYNKLY